MAKIVKKFGGTSLGDVSRIGMAAERVKESINRGNRVIVVVSAMAGETDRLETMAKAAGAKPGSTEHDAILTTGEQASAGLFAAALCSLGIKARSYLAWQIPIKSNGKFSGADITEIGTHTLLAALDEGITPVVAGFQGIGPDDRLNSLGRGGTDTSAVAIAAAIGADRADIYTDVPGVYAVNPHLVPGVRPLKAVSYRDMREMAMAGAKVLHPRAVDAAEGAGLLVAIRSSFEDTEGTQILPSVETVGRRHAVAIVNRSSGPDDQIITLVGDGAVKDDGIEDEIRKIVESCGGDLHQTTRNAYNIQAIVKGGTLKDMVAALHLQFCETMNG